ncbi:uncharacterized protein LOC125894961 isoform X2 [Epinephelus fuscoguttatus]|uniref:uncharacterized protein LOC125894961 isoform X2 n=1 Tax=Epinephelus fuscoguttatus TaxID=293821 RepID=UPI0020D0F262|nr:uncharacterized protein LOC125894961 isoform X2 [Epinephelus fuscoguttatus]
MEAVIGLLLMILGVSHGVETSCDGRQDGAQCYGALGGTVVLRLMDSASEIFRYKWSTKTTTILSGRKNLIVSNVIENRSSFTPSDGTFRINNVSWNDEGEYKLTIYDSNGLISEQQTLQLTIQGEETSCDGRQDGAQCYGALGGTVVLQLMDSASEIFRYQWSTKTTTILIGRKNQIVSNEIKNRSFFTPSDGTFRINDLSWSDGGEYTLITFDSDGRITEQKTLQLTIQGEETSCDGRQDGAQCYGALGGTVVLRLMDSASEISRYQWSNKTTVILSGRKNLIVSNEIENRSSFTPSDGTFRINNLSWSDGGEYKLSTYDSNGRISEERTLHLSIQAPVSSVLLVSECLSQGEMRVSCSSEGGDSPQYSWTLDGHTLTDAELLSGNTETTNITLKQHVSGELVCSVRNNVSSVSKEMKMTNCGFIFINCTLPNGTHISQWVFAANNTLCIEPTTAPTTTTETVGVETSCDGRQDGAQCYGALGGTVVLRLMDSASEIFSYRLSTKTTTILNGRKNLIVSNMIENRSSFTPSDGTFRVSKLSRSDEGEYTLEIYDSNGRISARRTLQLSIQAPVSSVLLVSECLSQGEMRVSCSSEGGDSPQYSWTLDGHTLTDAELLSGNTETTNITLKQHVSGQLVCSVRNKVSSVSKEMKMTNCGFIFINCTLPNGTHISQWVFAANNTLCIEPTTAPTTTAATSTVGKETVSILNPSTNITSSNQTVTPPSNDGPWYNNLPVMAGVLSALVLLLLIGVAVICSQRKKKNSKPKEEDDQELTYADVRIVQRQGMQMQQRQETQVEYGEVKFSERPRQPVEPAGDDCVYAKVRKAR